MMNKMILSNLAHRPLRSAISVVAIGLEVALILLIVGFSMGILDDSRARQAGIGADVIVLPPGSSTIVGITGAPMPVKIRDVIRRLPGVRIVSPVLIQVSTVGALQNIFGIELDSYEAMRPFVYLKGGAFEQTTDVLVDDVYANSRHVRVGDRIELLNHSFRISGIVEHGKGARLFLPLATLQDLNGAAGRASAFYVKADTPEEGESVAEEIKHVEGMGGYKVFSMREYLSMISPDNVPMLSIFIRIVIGIAVTIGVLVIFQAMYASVMERTREIGILKSMGASKLYIVNVILRETVLLSVAGIVMGFLFSFTASAGIKKGVPTLLFDINSRWMLTAALIAVAGSLAGAVYPAFRAAQKDPIDALAYE